MVSSLASTVFQEFNAEENRFLMVLLFIEFGFPLGYSVLDQIVNMLTFVGVRITRCFLIASHHKFGFLDSLSTITELLALLTECPSGHDAAEEKM